MDHDNKEQHEIEHSPCFKIDDIEHKGQGWIATKNIQKGTVIYQQSPEITIDLSKLTASSFETELCKCTKSEQESYCKLMSHGTYENKLLDIFSCNAVIYKSPKSDISLGGIFLKFAKLNHNCNANARWFFDEFDDVANEENVMKLITLRDIQVGDEITVSYLHIADEQLTTKQRKEELQSRWGFQCQCKWCDIDSISQQKADLALNSFCEKMDECDKIILKMAVNATTNEDNHEDIALCRFIYEMTNECLTMVTLLFDDNVHFLWKVYKRRLPAVLKLDAIDINEKTKCIQRFNELYEITKLDFNAEFVAAYYALGILNEFQYSAKFMEKFPNVIVNNNAYITALYQQYIRAAKPKTIEDDDSESESEEHCVGKLFDSDDDD